VHCALRVEKSYEHVLDVGLAEFQFLRPRGCLTNPFIILSLCFGIIGKTPGLISHNNFVNNIFVCIGHRDMSWQDVTRSSLCSGVKECATKRAHNCFPNPLSESKELQSWGSSKILLSLLM
jgi:hypothetical protein